jgi:two-component system, cell cycle response regulator DivK
MPVISPSPGPHSPLILIVDDNHKNRKLALDVLRAAGFRTLEAESGREGIKLAGEHLPDVILMDLRLPDMGGADAAQVLGAGPPTARIPVVALTALPIEASGDWLLATGFAGYLAKPISVREFPGQVRHYCARSR